MRLARLATLFVSDASPSSSMPTKAPSGFGSLITGIGGGAGGGDGSARASEDAWEVAGEAGKAAAAAAGAGAAAADDAGVDAGGADEGATAGRAGARVVFCADPFLPPRREAMSQAGSLRQGVQFPALAARTQQTVYGDPQRLPNQVAQRLTPLTQGTPALPRSSWGRGTHWQQRPGIPQQSPTAAPPAAAATPAAAPAAAGPGCLQQPAPRPPCASRCR